MANKAKHAHGASENVDAKIADGTLNEFDVLFLDANTKPKIGWITKEGKKVIVDTENVVVVNGDVLPESGETGKIYIFKNEAYFWNGNEFKPLTKSADLTGLETQISELETALGEKVDAETVQTMIEEHASSAVEIIEF